MDFVSVLLTAAAVFQTFLVSIKQILYRVSLALQSARQIYKYFLSQFMLMERGEEVLLPLSGDDGMLCYGNCYWCSEGNDWAWARGKYERLRFLGGM